MKDMEPYFGCSLKEIYHIERELGELSRTSWADQLGYETYEERHFSIISHRTKERIFFLNGLLFPITEDESLNYSQQIFEHWILGNSASIKHTSSEVDKYKRTKKYLSTELLNLFAQGSAEELKRCRAEFKINEKIPSVPDWKILHHPISSAGMSPDYTDVVKHCETNVPDYKVRLAYGVVSKTHFQRTDKENIARLLRSLLEKYNFDPKNHFEARDCSRSYEPVLLWPCKKSVVETNFHALIGINYGYDNGRSSYRLGMGIFIKDENLALKQLNSVVKNNYDAYSGSDHWDHHSNREKFEERLNCFFEQHYHRIMKNIVDLIKRSMNNSFYSPTSSLNLLLNTHSKTFKEEQDRLKELHDEFADRHGYNRYTHVLAWSKLAKELVDEQGWKSSVADFIASSILGWKK